MRKGGGFGVVVLLLVVAIVLLLVANRSKTLAPAAIQVHEAGERSSFPAHGQEDAAEALPSGGALPNLDEMGTNTGVHASQVQDALDEAN